MARTLRSAVIPSLPVGWQAREGTSLRIAYRAGANGREIPACRQAGLGRKPSSG